MDLSARNQLRGTVKSVRLDGLMAEVVIDVGGQAVRSVITRDAAEHLGLASGQPVIAVMKATEVLVGKP